jgi:CRP/FNR family transcriptional regulator, anaerobic regulatory protein
MENYLDYLNRVSPISEEIKVDLRACFKTFIFEKNTEIVSQGYVCNYLYFVESGLVRLFYWQDGKEITDYFAFENQIIGGIDSFFSRKPSYKIIKTIEPSTLIAISYDDLNRLFEKHHDFEKVGRLLTTYAFLSMQERLFSIQFHPAKQRYESLIKANPDILQRVPLGQIASFLGITQVTLSRIRALK